MRFPGSVGLRPLTRDRHPEVRGAIPQILAMWLILCVLLGALLSGAAARSHPDEAVDDAPEPGWKVLAHRHMGASGWASDYTVTLRTLDTQAFPLDPGDRPLLRFDVAYRANGTVVIDDRPLQVFLFVCQPPVEGPRAELPDCDPAVRQNTERGALLERVREAPEGAPAMARPAFVYQPQEGVLDREATWYVEAAFPDPQVNETAVFVLTVGHPEVGTILDAIEGLGIDGAEFVRLAAFVVVLVLFYTAARGLTYLLGHTVLTPARMEPTGIKLINRLIVGGVLAVGLAMSLYVVWGVNVWAVVTALGLLTVALGFGMQNTVANLMGGISLALDKPFVIGDRIQVGDSWGDVLAIGMRSTTIETPKREIVIIPNKLLDEREIWNYTLGHPEMRLDLEVGISYDSDWRLAQVLMLEAAQENDEILDYPRPVVHMRSFSESSTVLQLRCWMAAAKNMRNIDSNLRKAIKDKFDQEGVEIPYPYRTIVEKRELPKPRSVTQDDLDRVAFADRGTTRMLVLASGVEPAKRSARLVVRVARELDVAVVLAHIRPRVDYHVRRTANVIFGYYKNAAQAENVEVQTRIAEGDLLEMARRLIDEHKVDLVVLGSGRTNIFGAPTKVSELTRQLRQTTDVPILVVPKNLVIPDRTIDHYRRRLERRSAERKQAERQISAVPTTDDEAKEAELKDSAGGRAGRLSDDETPGPYDVGVDDETPDPGDDRDDQPHPAIGRRRR